MSESEQITSIEAEESSSWPKSPCVVFQAWPQGFTWKASQGNTALPIPDLHTNAPKSLNGVSVEDSSPSGQPDSHVYLYFEPRHLWPRHSSGTSAQASLLGGRPWRHFFPLWLSTLYLSTPSPHFHPAPAPHTVPYGKMEQVQSMPSLVLASCLYYRSK